MRAYESAGQHPDRRWAQRSERVGEDAKVGEQTGEVGWLVVGVDATRIGEEPDLTIADQGGLEADDRSGFGEGNAVGGEADHCKDPRSEAMELAAQSDGTSGELRGCELVGGGRRSRNEVGDTKPEGEEGSIFGWMIEARSEAGGMEGRPEAVAGSPEVVANRSAVKAGVNAAEQDSKVWGNDVAEPLVDRVAKLICFRAHVCGRSGRAGGRSWSCGGRLAHVAGCKSSGEGRVNVERNSALAKRLKATACLWIARRNENRRLCRQARTSSNYRMLIVSKDGQTKHSQVVHSH